MTAGTRRTRLVAAACLAVLAVLLPGCAFSGDTEKSDAKGKGKESHSADSSMFEERKAVSVIVLKGHPGFSTRSGTEYEYAGFDIALSKFLGGRMGFTPRPHDVPPGEREQRLTEGDGDLAVASYTITDARDKKIDFTAPYFKTYQGVLIRKDNTDIKKVADLDGKRVCSAEGTTSDPNAMSKQHQRRLRNALGAEAVIGLRKDDKTCVQELRKGNFEAVWTDKILLAGFAHTPPYSHDVRLAPDITIENRQFYGIGIAEGQEQDCRRVNKALREFLAQSWRDTFQSHFSEIARNEPDFEQKYKPTDREFEAYEAKSCGAQ